MYYSNIENRNTNTRSIRVLTTKISLASQEEDVIFRYKFKKYKHMTNQNIANVVVAVLKEVEMDGEMMEWIINQVGMRDQMIKQLVTNKEELEELTIVTSFSRQQLIEYTREIQERCKQTINEAIKNLGIDFDDMVELELNYNKTIEVNFDDHQLYKEIESAMDDALYEIDSEAIYSEAMDVIENMNEV